MTPAERRAALQAEADRRGLRAPNTPTAPRFAMVDYAPRVTVESISAPSSPAVIQGRSMDEEVERRTRQRLDAIPRVLGVPVPFVDAPFDRGIRSSVGGYFSGMARDTAEAGRAAAGAAPGVLERVARAPLEAVGGVAGRLEEQGADALPDLASQAARFAFRAVPQAITDATLAVVPAVGQFAYDATVGPLLDYSGNVERVAAEEAGRDVRRARALARGEGPVLVSDESPELRDARQDAAGNYFWSLTTPLLAADAAAVAGAMRGSGAGVRAAESAPRFARVAEEVAGNRAAMGASLSPRVEIFAGRNARTADLQALSRAEEMEAAGATREAIWNETGWFKGVDGKWRWEIDDKGSVYRGLPDVESERFDLQRALQRRYGGTMAEIRERHPDDPDVARYAALYDRNMQRITGNLNQTPADRLSDAFDHPGLGAAYPRVMDTPFGEGGVSSNSRGHFNTGTGSLHVDGDMPIGERRSTVLHEAQHAVQRDEGFAKGGGLETFTQQAEAELARDALAWRREIARKRKEMPEADRIAVENAVVQEYQQAGIMDWLPSREARDVAGDIGGNPDAALEEIVRVYGLDRSVTPMSPKDGYLRLAGEVEARNVQTRRDFTPEERRVRPPWETQDVPDADQIVRFDPVGVQQSARISGGPLDAWRLRNVDADTAAGTQRMAGQRGFMLDASDNANFEPVLDNAGNPVLDPELGLPLVRRFGEGRDRPVTTIEGFEDEANAVVGDPIEGANFNNGRRGRLRVENEPPATNAPRSNAFPANDVRNGGRGAAPTDPGNARGGAPFRPVLGDDWYHGSYDTRRIREGGFERRTRNHSYITDPDRWWQLQDEMTAARAAGDDAKYMALLEEAGRLRASEEVPRPVYITSDRRMASSYASGDRAFDYQNAVPGVLSVEHRLQNPLKVDGGGARFAALPIERVRAGVPANRVAEFDNLVRSSADPTLVAQGRLRTEDLEAIAYKMGFDGFEIRNVVDDYNAVGKPGTVRAVFDMPTVRAPDGRPGNAPRGSPDDFGVGADGSAVQMGQLRARRAEAFSDPRLSATENKAVEMARNGFTTREIAEEMDVSDSAVYKFISTARAKAPDIEIPGARTRAMSDRNIVSDALRRGLSRADVRRELNAERSARGLDPVTDQTFLKLMSSQGRQVRSQEQRNNTFAPVATASLGAPLAYGLMEEAEARPADPVPPRPWNRDEDQPRRAMEGQRAFDERNANRLAEPEPGQEERDDSLIRPVEAIPMVAGAALGRVALPTMARAAGAGERGMMLARVAGPAIGGAAGGGFAPPEGWTPEQGAMFGGVMGGLAGATESAGRIAYLDTLAERINAVEGPAARMAAITRAGEIVPGTQLRELDLAGAFPAGDTVRPLDVPALLRRFGEGIRDRDTGPPLRATISRPGVGSEMSPGLQLPEIQYPDVARGGVADIDLFRAPDGTWAPRQRNEDLADTFLNNRSIGDRVNLYLDEQQAGRRAIINERAPGLPMRLFADENPRIAELRLPPERLSVTEGQVGALFASDRNAMLEPERRAAATVRALEEEVDAEVAARLAERGDTAPRTPGAFSEDSVASPYPGRPPFRVLRNPSVDQAEALLASATRPPGDYPPALRVGIDEDGNVLVWDMYAGQHADVEDAFGVNFGGTPEQYRGAGVSDRRAIARALEAGTVARRGRGSAPALAPVDDAPAGRSFADMTNDELDSAFGYEKTPEELDIDFLVENGVPREMAERQVLGLQPRPAPQAPAVRLDRVGDAPGANPVEDSVLRTAALDEGVAPPRVSPKTGRPLRTIESLPEPKAASALARIPAGRLKEVAAAAGVPAGRTKTETAAAIARAVSERPRLGGMLRGQFPDLPLSVLIGAGVGAGVGITLAPVDAEASGGPIVPGAAQALGAVAGAVGGGLMVPRRGIRAFHGSPHDFDRFSMSKIGTGEGAQAYGHGLYFAEAEDVARGYRSRLAGKGLSLRETVEKHLPGAGSQSVLAKIYSEAINGHRDLDRAARAVQMHLPELRDEGVSFMGPLGDQGRRIADAIADIREQSRGRMYEVNINASPDEFLDWDAPLRAQGESVRRGLGWTPDAEAEWRAASRSDVDALAAALEGDAGAYRPTKLPVPAGLPPLDATGAEIVRGGSVFANPNARAISERLRDTGIPGIRYLDAGSRVTPRWQVVHPQGGVNDFASEAEALDFISRNPEVGYSLVAPNQSRNYVVFDDSLIDILRKYGLAGLTAGGAGAAAGASQQGAPRFQPVM